MPKNSNVNSSSAESEVPYIISHPAISMTILAALLLIIFSGVYWNKVYISPRRVFEGMLNQNLSTLSVTKKTVTNGSEGFEKYDQLSFAQPQAVRSLVAIDQKGEKTSSVLTETIGTTSNDYSQYLKIKTNQKGNNGNSLDYSTALNKWGKTEAGQPAQYLDQALIGLMPFGNLTAKDRSKILEQIKNNKVYEVSYDSVKPKKLGKKSALVFQVRVNIAEHIKVLKAVAKASGISELNDLEPAQYDGQPPLSITLTVDKTSRQLLELEYGQQTESYIGYGQSQTVQIPSKTISTSELQQKVEEIK